MPPSAPSLKLFKKSSFKPTHLNLPQRATQGEALEILQSPNSDTLVIRADPDPSRSAILAVTSPTLSTATTPSPSTTSTSNSGSPKWVPAVAVIFTLLGVGAVVVIMVVFWRRSRNRVAQQEQDEISRAKWSNKWRSRGFGHASDRDTMTTSSQGLVTPPHTPPQPSWAPVRPARITTAGLPDTPRSQWSPFRLTPYQISFTIKMPNAFRRTKHVAKKPSTASSGRKELILPSMPRPAYDRRTPSAGPIRPPRPTYPLSLPSLGSRPSFKSTTTTTSPPPAYMSRSGSNSTVSNSVHSNHSPPPPKPHLPAPPRVLDIRPPTISPVLPPSPDPYHRIPSPVPTPLSQTVTIPRHPNLPLTRTMQVISTFTPALSDEMRIQIGQVLRLLEEYDDGWCLVERVDGASDEQGAIPRFCIDELPNEHMPPPSSGSSFRSIATFSTGPLPSPRRHQSLRRPKKAKAKAENLLNALSAPSRTNRI